MTDTSRRPRASSWGDASDVLRLLLDRGEWTRSDIARTLSLSRSTIALRLDALRDAGLLRDAGRLAPEGGRPTTKIALNDAVRSVAAIELGHSSSRVSLADLGACPRGTVELPVAQTDGFEQILRAASEGLRTLLREQAERLGPLSGVTLGVPLSAKVGAVGMRNPSGQTGWASFPAQEWLQEELGVPVHVENDVNLMVLGEQLEVFPDARDLILLHAGDGIGLGVMADGALIRGAAGQAGEIAHVPALRDNDEQCLCGNIGCLGAVATLPAILKMLRGEGVDIDSIEGLTSAVAAGDARAGRAVRQAGRDVGDVVAYAIATTNPGLLVVGGELSAVGDHFVAGVKESLFRRGAPALTDGLHVTRSSRSAGAGTLGALRLAADGVLAGRALFDLLGTSSAN
ncbi:ROK family transcriptional regulator [Microbacter sp. GSS18]|nr:ROK family transcriptional regulator [Microbacter sp. GSS18]